MKLSNLSSMLATALFSFSLTACGGGVDIDKVRADFNSPSGSTANKEAVMAAQGRRDASTPATKLGAGASPFGALSLDTRFDGLRKLSVRETWRSRAQQILASRSGKQVSFLSTAQAGNTCDDAAAASAAWTKLATGSKSASYTLDLATCSAGELTGTLKVTMKVEGNETAGRFTIDQQFTNVCETSGTKSCLNGAMLMELSANSTTGRFEFLTGWDFDAKWTEGNVQREASLKGGLRFGGTETTFALEMLVYVTTPDGKEWSYVLSFSGDDQGNGNFSIRGSDGELSCTISEESVSCTGNAELAWTLAEQSALSDDWYR